MDADEMALREQIQAHKKRLRILEERAALQGINTPPEVIIEIAEITNRIGVLKRQIGGMQNEDFTENHLEIDSKYYIYVSYTKLDMLYQQEGSSVKIEELDTYPGKIRVVVDTLNKRRLVGDIETPGEYFKAVLPMQWGPIGDDMVYFRGKFDGITIFLAGFSLNYMKQNRHYFLNAQSAMQVALTLEMYEGKIKSAKKSRLRRFRELLATAFPWLKDSDAEQGRSLVHAPFERVEVFAKTVLFQSYSSPMLLGTPLYVALAD